MGCDDPDCDFGTRKTVFQSTHPSGVRLFVATASMMQLDFNPRTPVGCDADIARRYGFGKLISIHAPQWGATVYYCDSRTSYV